MARVEKTPVKRMDGNASLIARSLITVRVASFVFQFETVEQLQECIRYYEKKTRASSRISSKRLAAELGEDWRRQRGWEVERWFERLPMYLLEEPRRQKVLKALRKALVLLESKKI